MKIWIILLNLLIILQNVKFIDCLAGTMCNIIDQNALFTLDFMNKENDYNYTLDDGSQIYFQFCSYAKHKCNNNERNAYAILESKDGEKCDLLTADQKWESSTTDDNSGYRVSLIDQNRPQDGIILQIFEGDAFSQNLYYNVKFLIHCNNSEAANSKFTINSVTQNNNQFTIDGYSTSGCPILQLSEIWNYLSEHKILFAIILIVTGIAECFYGLKILPLTLFTIGYFTGFGVLIAILGEFVILPGTNAIVIWVLLIISILFGLLLGYITTSMRKLGFFFLGFWLGTVLAFLLNNALLYKLNYDNVPLWLAIGILGGLFGIASCFFYKHIVIISTATVGAYALIRPFGWIAKGFPNEFAIAQQIRYNQISEIPNEFYLYLSLILVVAGLGMKIQYYYYFKDKSLDKEFQLDDKGNDLDEELVLHEDEDDDQDKEDGETKQKSLKKNNSKDIIKWVSGKISDFKNQKVQEQPKISEMGNFNQDNDDEELNEDKNSNYRNMQQEEEIAKKKKKSQQFQNTKKLKKQKKNKKDDDMQELDLM